MINTKLILDVYENRSDKSKISTQILYGEKFSESVVSLLSILGKSDTFGISHGSEPLAMYQPLISTHFVLRHVLQSTKKHIIGWKNGD